MPHGEVPVDIAAGTDRSCVLFESGSVLCWGRSEQHDFALGYDAINRTTYPSLTTTEPVASLPYVQLPQNTSAVAIDAGGASCAILNTGGVFCWGHQRTNYTGGNRGLEYAPAMGMVTTAGMQAAQISVGKGHACIILVNQSLACWGDNEEGQLGFGDFSPRVQATLVPLPGVARAETVSAGYQVTCVTLIDGHVHCWGLNTDGQLGLGMKAYKKFGNGPSDPPPLPANVTPSVALPFAAINVAAGAQTCCAMSAQRNVTCWGDGTWGQLGNGNLDSALDGGVVTPNDAKQPVPLPPGTAPVQVAVGHGHTCLLHSDTSVRCWGRNHFGQLGIGSRVDSAAGTRPSNLPEVPMLAGRNVTQLAAGPWHTCAVMNGTDVACWGWVSRGYIGYSDNTLLRGSAPANSMIAESLPLPKTLGNIVKLAAGYDHMCVVYEVRGVKCWGNGKRGQLGYGEGRSIGFRLDSTGLVKLPLNRKVDDICVGGMHTCVLLDNTDVVCWGGNKYNDPGALGNGELRDWGESPDRLPSNAPKVELPGPAKQITCGYRHSCALLHNGLVYCWGSGDNGRLGYGNYRDVLEIEDIHPAGPVQLPGNLTAVEVAAGAKFTCAILESGELSCWGGNEHGQLGYKSRKDMGQAPDRIPALMGVVPFPRGTKVKSVTANRHQTCVISEKEELFCFGSNFHNGLGWGVQAQLTPVIKPTWGPGDDANEPNNADSEGSDTSPSSTDDGSISSANDDGTTSDDDAASGTSADAAGATNTKQSSSEAGLGTGGIAGVTVGAVALVAVAAAVAYKYRLRRTRGSPKGHSERAAQSFDGNLHDPQTDTCVTTMTNPLDQAATARSKSVHQQHLASLEKSG